MSINVDIGDRLYDYTDEEKASLAVAEFQAQYGLDDDAVVKLWEEEGNVLRADLEKRIFQAVDENGSAQRAQQNVPSGISLSVD